MTMTMTLLKVIRTTAVAAFALTAAVVATTAMLMMAAQSAPSAQAAQTIAGNDTYETASTFVAFQITAQTAENGVFDPAVNSEG
ncbi:MAG: hypothetical protein AAFO77_08110 [Pseudomonadota bacterium]